MWLTSGGDELEGAWKVKSGSFAALGSGKPKIVAITKKQIENLELIVPPIELQNQFTAFVNQVDKLKFEMENSLKELCH